MSTIERWSKPDSTRKLIPCPQIVLTYNKSMGGVDLADMLIAIYRITVKTNRWYIKVLWHLVDIAKVNGWLLYRPNFVQKNVPAKRRMSLLDFTTELADALMHTKQHPTKSPRGRPPKHVSAEENETPCKRGKRASVPAPCTDVRFDEVGHWPLATKENKCCRLCHAYVRVMCQKCNLALCLLPERNCFLNFHTK